MQWDSADEDNDAAAAESRDWALSVTEALQARLSKLSNTTA